MGCSPLARPGIANIISSAWQHQSSRIKVCRFAKAREIERGQLDPLFETAAGKRSAHCRWSQRAFWSAALIFWPHIKNKGWSHCVRNED